MRVPCRASKPRKSRDFVAAELKRTGTVHRHGALALPGSAGPAGYHPEPVPELLEKYVALHNRGVREGDFTELGALFHPNARLAFRGVPLGPFEGRDAIARAFAERPPSDELRIRHTSERPGTIFATYGWAAAPAVGGSLRARHDGDRIRELLIAVFQLRPGRDDDLRDLCAIYNHYVVESHVTFDTEPQSVEQRRAWLDGFSSSGPYRLFVAELAGRAVGYAASGRHRPRPGYRTSVETSVYVAPTELGLGIGHALCELLLETLDAEPELHRAYAGIALPNPSSVALHEALGFEHVGTFREVGFKLGRYWDVGFWERKLSGGPPR